MRQPIAIYKTGSSCILEKSNDNDLVYFYATKEEAREALIKYRHTEKADVHFAPISSVQKVFLGCYILPFMVKVSGEDIDLSFNFLQHKEEYIELLKQYLNMRKQSKLWYHIYIAVRMLEKGKRTLNKSEKEKAQSIHDNGIDDETFNYVFDYLTK